MRRWSLTVVSVLAIAATAAARCAAQDAIAETTEFGITVTPNQLLDVIQESADFWPSVRLYVSGDKFKVAEHRTRQEAAAFLKRVNEQLYQRLVGDDQVAATDLLDFLATRSRKYLLLQQMRGIVADDVIAIRLMERWEQSARLVRLLPADERKAGFERVLASVREEMAASHLAAEKIESAMPVWNVLAECTVRLDATSAGQIMLDFEKEAMAGDPAVAELLRAISAAADWAQVAKADKVTLKRADFIAAWEYVAKLNPPRMAAKMP